MKSSRTQLFFLLFLTLFSPLFLLSTNQDTKNQQPAAVHHLQNLAKNEQLMLGEKDYIILLKATTSVHEAIKTVANSGMTVKVDLGGGGFIEVDKDGVDLTGFFAWGKRAALILTLQNFIEFASILSTFVGSLGTLPLGKGKYSGVEDVRFKALSTSARLKEMVDGISFLIEEDTATFPGKKSHDPIGNKIMRANNLIHMIWNKERMSTDDFIFLHRILQFNVGLVQYMFIFDQKLHLSSPTLLRRIFYSLRNAISLFSINLGDGLSAQNVRAVLLCTALGLGACKLSEHAASLPFMRRRAQNNNPRGAQNNAQGNNPAANNNQQNSNSPLTPERVAAIAFFLLISWVAGAL